MDNKFSFNGDDLTEAADSMFGSQQARPAPDLPPRIDRASKPNGTTPPSTLGPTPTARTSSSATTNGNGTYGRSAHERLFAAKPLITDDDEYGTRVLSPPDKRSNGTNGSSLERKLETPSTEKVARTPSSANKTNGSSYDSVSSYDSTNLVMQSMRLGPNAPDDLKSVPK